MEMEIAYFFIGPHEWRSTIFQVMLANPIKKIEDIEAVLFQRE
jgi:hypothetical protein